MIHFMIKYEIKFQMEDHWHGILHKHNYSILHLMLTNGNNFRMESHRRGMLLSMLLPTVQYVGIKHPGTVHVMLTYYDIDLYFRWKIIDAGCYYRCCYLRGYQASWLAWHRHGVYSLHILINPNQCGRGHICLTHFPRIFPHAACGSFLIHNCAPNQNQSL